MAWFHFYDEWGGLLLGHNYWQMKKNRIAVLVAVLIVTVSSCKEVILLKGSPGKSGSAPGQVKKATGSQSAKPYAPGQQKKKN